MRVERIQPEGARAEGTADTVTREQKVHKQKKVLKQFMTPLAEMDIKRAEEDSKISEEALKSDFLQLLQEKVNQLNGTMELFNKKLHFEIHEETERVMVMILEAETEEVIKEIPPERILDMLARLEEMIGLLIDERI